MSPTGIFANLAGTNALPISSGFTHQAAIVGLGFANANKSPWSLGADETIIAGIYGSASNSGTAPSFGGYFRRLKACGLVLNRRIIHDGSPQTTQLTDSDVVVISITNSGQSRTIYLPNDGIEGRVIRVIQMGRGSVRVDTSGGQVIADDSSNNDYFIISDGESAEFTFGIWNIGGITSQVWSMGKYKF